MTPPDVFKAARLGWLAFGLSLLVALGLCWFNWSDSPDAEAALAKSCGDAEKIRGKEALSARVARQRAANQALKTELATLKQEAGFEVQAKYTIPADSKQPGQDFKTLYTDVRQSLRTLADAKGVDRDEVLGFAGADSKVDYKDSDIPLNLAMLQLTEKTMQIVLNAPDPVERYTITHANPVETGPADRPPLLREYPLRLEVTGSLKTILTIVHRMGQVEGDDYPLIVRGLTITSANTKTKDDVQQLRATIEIAGMQFLSDTERGDTPSAAAAASNPQRAGMARP